MRSFSLYLAPSPLHHPKPSLPDPYLCSWQDCPPFCHFRSPQNLRCPLRLWESLWTLMRLGRQGPYLREDVTDVETQIT